MLSERNNKKNKAQRAYYARNRIALRAKRKIWQASLRGYFCKKLAVTAARAKKSSIVFDLTYVDLELLYTKQQGYCVLTRRKLCLKRAGSLNSLSVDRINHRKGYVRNNIRLVTWQANSARGFGTDAQLVSFCRDVLKWSRRQS